MKKFLIVGIFVGLALALTAQEPEKAKPEEKAPTLSSEQKLKLENIQLKSMNLQQQKENAQLKSQNADLNAVLLGEQSEALKAEFEKDHPGYTLDNSGAPVKKPKAEPEKKK